MSKSIGYLKLLSIAFLVVFFLCGCTKLYVNSNYNEKYDTVQLHPQATEKSTTITLYYGISGEDYIVPVTKEVVYSDAPPNDFFAVRELIKSETEAGLINYINPNTEVVTLGISNDTVSVCLSEDILMVPATEDGNWQMDESKVKEVMRQRKMAVYCIVNTLTEFAPYTRVQIYIDQKNNNSDEMRVSRGTLGFVGDGLEMQTLEALPRDNSCVLTPANTVKLALNYLGANQAENFFAQLEQVSAGMNAQEFSTKFSVQKMMLGDYYVHDNYTVSGDGSAVVMIDYAIRMGSVISEYKSIPVRLRLSGCRYYIDGSFANTVLRG